MAIHFRLRLLVAVALCLFFAAACGGGRSASAPRVVYQESERYDDDRYDDDDDDDDYRRYTLLSRGLDALSPSLYSQGGVRRSGTASNYRYSFDDWGFVAREGGRRLFDAYIDGGANPYLRVSGRRSNANPTSGSASWSGQVRAFDTRPGAFGTPISGTARVRVDFGAAELDVDFTGFTGGHGNMAWRGLDIVNGAFRHGSGLNMIRGAFYGSGHQGAAGIFERNRLKGVFGTLRD